MALARLADSTVLTGRQLHMTTIQSLLNQAAQDEGAALVLVGDIGVGKSALLAAGVSLGRACGFRVLEAQGLEAETALPFAGLLQLLLPAADCIERLPPGHRRALRVALGLEIGTPPEHMLLFEAVSRLLTEYAAGQPLLIVLDDAQWLDPASTAVLGLIVRRLAHHGFGILIASLPDDPSFCAPGDLPCLDVPPLNDDEAGALLDRHFPVLAQPVRRRLLAEAQGNPLAIVELPAALSAAQKTALAPLPAILPLGERLSSKLAARFTTLPAPARHLLLLAALDSQGGAGALGATRLISRSLNDLVPAERAQVVRIDGTSAQLTFRHPLMRSAVIVLSTGLERRQAHGVLALLYADSPQQRAAHLAESTFLPDESVASLLQDNALVALQHGDAVGAMHLMLRSADLSPVFEQRSQRLVMAGNIGANVTGDLRMATGLLEDGHACDSDAEVTLTSALVAAYQTFNGEGDLDAAHRLLVRALMAKGHPLHADDRAVLESVYVLARLSFLGGRPQLWQSVPGLMARIDPQAPPQLMLVVKSMGEPAAFSAGELASLDALVDSIDGEHDPIEVIRIATAAFFTDRLPACIPSLWRVILSGREGGAVAGAIEALTLIAWDRLFYGDLDGARELLDEQARLSVHHGYQVAEWSSLTAEAFIGAVRGDSETALDAANRVASWASTRRLNCILAIACHVRALVALGRGDFEEAYRQARFTMSSEVPAPNAPYGLWRFIDLVEAAVRTGRRDEAIAHVAALQAAVVSAISPRIEMLVWGAAALVASDEEADACFARALAVDGTTRWSFERARIQLYYGEWLRRNRMAVRARPYLEAACETFRDLEAALWMQRAESERRAAGAGQSASELPALAASGPLTPRESDIAGLAAAGLSNKQIGQQLSLSHRTVGAHLYKVFRKLGVTSRAGLRDALASETAGYRRFT